MIWICGFFAGIFSALGIGGGILLIPALLSLTELSQTQVQSVTLLYFAPVAVVALYQHRKAGLLRTDVFRATVGWGILGAFAGAGLALWMDGEWLRKGFGVLLLILGVRELFLPSFVAQARKED